MHRPHCSNAPKSYNQHVAPFREAQPSDTTVEPRTIDIFNGLPGEAIAAIRNKAVQRTFGASDIIVAAEEKALQFFVLEDGLVDYVVSTKDGREILLRRLIPGDPFGLAALLAEPLGYLGTATSVRSARALVWRQPVIHELGVAHPRLLENALRIGLHYIALYTQRHIALVSNSARERVAGALATLASRTGHALPSGLEVEVKNEELASLADVNSYSVSRFLRQWDREGTVKKSRGRIVVQCPEHLVFE